MMKLINIRDKQVYNIPTANIESSPLLRTMLNTELPVDMDLEGNIMLDCDPEELEQYMNYLMGYDFSVLSGELFKYFGHVNDMDYPLDFWEVKLYDTWVRDNCHRLSLFKDNPYYGLYEIDISSLNCNTRAKQSIDTINSPPGHYVAGGVALYVLGITDTYNDIDIFTTDLVASEEYIKESMNTGLLYTDNSVIFPQIDDNRKQKQLILRKYSCPSEIVHGFDVGCCGVIMSYSRFPRMWCTRRALYSIKNRCNWIEPDRSSPSYIHRLLKYSNRKISKNNPFELKVRPPGSITHEELWDSVETCNNNKRGFKIMLTGIGDLTMDGTYYNKFVENMMDNYVYSKPVRNIAINMKELTLWLFKRGVKNAQKHMIRFVQNTRLRKILPLPKNLRSVGRLTDGIIQDNGLIDSLKKDGIISTDDYHTRSIELHQLILTLAVSGIHLDEWTNLTDQVYKCHNNRKDIHPYLDFNANWFDIGDQYSDSLPDGMMSLIYDYDTEIMFKIHSISNIIKRNPNIIKLVRELEFPIYDDLPSLVLLEAMYGIGYSLLMGDIKSDYDIGETKKLMDIKELQWKDINPMEQLTGTFHPESIDDMREWYCTSPLIIPNGVEIIPRR